VAQASPTKFPGSRLEKLTSAKWTLGVALLVPALSLCVCAQNIDEFLPEVDLHRDISPNLDAVFQAKQTREGGSPTQGEIGPSIEFGLRSTGLKNARNRQHTVLLSFGYRYLPAPSAPPTNRIEPVATFRFPAVHEFVLSDRNRADLDWQSGSFFWRYRNLWNIERALTFHSYPLTPYASVEFFYQSQYSKWSDTAIYSGCSFPIRKRFVLAPYYEHQNITGKSPNRQLNQLGLKLSVNLSR
jgi:hypothetical protein